jgi:hypothetical protein
MDQRSQEDIEREIESLSPENIPWMLHPLAIILHPIVIGAAYYFGLFGAVFGLIVGFTIRSLVIEERKKRREELLGFSGRFS